MVEKEAHAQGLGALHGDEEHLAADVVVIVQPGRLCLIAFGILFQAGDAVLDALAEAWADLDGILHGMNGRHGWHLGRREQAEYFPYFA
ncbi:MAG TPA: hypothetical protein VMV57_02315 [Terracidiphilus sp.]|nr:hypothetical protein [Terracidiphilus sp.]